MSEFTCKCKVSGCGHSLLVTDTGLRLVTRKEWFRANGIPKLEDSVKVAKFMVGAAVKWVTPELEYAEAA